MNHNPSTILQAHQMSWCTVDPKATSLAMQGTKSKVSWKNLAMWDWCEVIIRIVCVCIWLVIYYLFVFVGNCWHVHLTWLYCSNNYVCIDISQVFWFVLMGSHNCRNCEMLPIGFWKMERGSKCQSETTWDRIVPVHPLSLDAMSLLGRTQWWCTAHLHLCRICLNGMTCTNHVCTYRTDKNIFVEHNNFPHFRNLKDFHVCLNLKCNHSIPNLEGRKIVDLLSFDP